MGRKPSQPYRQEAVTVTGRSRPRPVATGRATPYYRHVRSCSIYISHRDLDPSDVTEAMGISPDRSFRRGEIHNVLGRPMPHHHGTWSLDSDAHIASEDLADHLDFVAQFARQHREGILALRARGLPVRVRIDWALGDSVLSAALDAGLVKMLCDCIEGIDLSVV